VRFTPAAALPSTGVRNRSKLVDQGSVRPAMRAENTSDLPSGLNAKSSIPAEGLAGECPHRTPADTSMGAAPAPPA